MTYNVFGGTLNLTQSINQSIQFLHRQQIILLGDRGTRVWTT